MKATAIFSLIGLAATACSGTVSPAPGDQRSWALEFGMRLEQPDGKTPAEVRLSGELIMTISASRPAEYDASVEIAGARIRGAAGTSVPQEAAGELERRIGRRFWGTWRSDGTLLAVHFYKDVSPADRNLLQTILTEAQFVRPPSAEPVWTVLERDGAGAYLAIYQQAAPATVIKRRLKYVETTGVAGAPSGALQIAVDRSELRFTFDARGQIASLDGSDRAKIVMPVESAGSLTASMEIHLSALHTGRADNLIGSLAAAQPDVENLPVVTHRTDPEVARRQRDEQLIAGRSTESLLSAAFTAASDNQLPDRLAALFRRRPEAASDALAMLQSRGPLTRLTDALGRSSAPAAVKTLGVLARDESRPVRLRVDALIGLAMGEHASLEAMKLAAGLLDDTDRSVAAAACMVAGALARSGRTEHPRDADALDHDMIERYRAAADDDRKLAVLLAGLGNSASPAAAAVIEPAAHDPRPVVRGAAVRALRLVQGNEIDGLLSEAIGGDSDASVRAGALLAAGFHHHSAPALNTAVIEAARTDSADFVRSAAVTLLARAEYSSPHTSETLAWIAANDASPRIRRQAREALAGREAAVHP